MYLLESQLRHDQVLLSLLEPEDASIPEFEREQRRSKSRKQRNWTIRKGLRALSAGLDNNGRNARIEHDVRREQFVRLWWRLCICHCASYIEHHETRAPPASRAVRATAAERDESIKEVELVKGPDRSAPVVMAITVEAR